MTPEYIKQQIEAGLPGSQVTVSGDGTHFEALVVSDVFAGRKPLERHRMVYATLGDKVGGDIHALSIRACTPEEAARS
jgi:acid stress-induced BolA-like protein IbaG/YrbA